VDTLIRSLCVAYQCLHCCHITATCLQLLSISRPDQFSLYLLSMCISLSSRARAYGRARINDAYAHVHTGFFTIGHVINKLNNIGHCQRDGRVPRCDTAGPASCMQMTLYTNSSSDALIALAPLLAPHCQLISGGRLDRKALATVKRAGSVLTCCCRLSLAPIAKRRGGGEGIGSGRGKSGDASLFQFPDLHATGHATWYGNVMCLYWPRSSSRLT
jgi:hypothetical protein